MAGPRPGQVALRRRPAGAPRGGGRWGARWRASGGCRSGRSPRTRSAAPARMASCSPPRRIRPPSARSVSRRSTVSSPAARSGSPPGGPGAGPSPWARVARAAGRGRGALARCGDSGGAGPKTNCWGLQEGGADGDDVLAVPVAPVGGAGAGDLHRPVPSLPRPARRLPRQRAHERRRQRAEAVRVVRPADGGVGRAPGDRAVFDHALAEVGQAGLVGGVSGELAQAGAEVGQGRAGDQASPPPGPCGCSSAAGSPFKGPLDGLHQALRGAGEGRDVQAPPCRPGRGRRRPARRRSGPGRTAPAPGWP